MRVREMRELTLEELKARIDDTRKEVVELRFQLAQRKLENTAKLRTQRKKLAQLLTIETEKEKDSGANEVEREAKVVKVAEADLARSRGARTKAK